MLYPLFLVIAAIGAFFISPLVIGMIGGVLFNIALKKKTQLLAITCILGCIIGLVISSIILSHMHAVVRYVAFGLITGIFLGAGMYLAEKTPTT
jgi:glucose uptake protein GlcU